MSANAPTDDFYATLGVSTQASAEDIRKAYKFLMMALHPDRFSSAPSKREAEERAKRINQAYAILKDDAARRRYDEARARQAGSSPGGRQSPKPPPDTPASPAADPTSAPHHEPSQGARRSSWDTEVRQLARAVATELSVTRPGTANPDAAVGWRLWSGITRTGSTEPRGSGDAYLFSWWTYTTTLALCTDGQLVTFDEIEGRMSPNDGGTPGIRLATSESLSYPDVIRWRDKSQVEEAPIRKITEIYRIPEEYSYPRGRGLTEALEDLRAKHRPPQPLDTGPRSASPVAIATRRSLFRPVAWLSVAVACVCVPIYLSRVIGFGDAHGWDALVEFISGCVILFGTPVALIGLVTSLRAALRGEYPS